jgi:DedD protein
METRLKERLTGAAILVALIVMVVPEMFHGQGSDIVALPGSSGEGPPVRSYTIDLSNSPTRAGPLQSTPANAGSAGPNDKAGIVMQVEPGSAPATTPAASAPAAASVAAAPATPAAPAASAPTATAAAAPKTAPAPVANTHPSPAPAHNGAESGWIVQLGLFAKRENAERLAHSAQGRGFAVSVSNADAKGLYRVYAGGMADRSAAESYSQRLRDQGMTAAVVASP